MLLIRSLMMICNLRLFLSCWVFVDVANKAARKSTITSRKCGWNYKSVYGGTIGNIRVGFHKAKCGIVLDDQQHVTTVNQMAVEKAPREYNSSLLETNF